MCTHFFWIHSIYPHHFICVVDFLLFCYDIYSILSFSSTRYLANDMQFFLTSPIIIFALWKHRTLGLTLLSTLLVWPPTPRANKINLQVTFTVIPVVLGFVNNWGFSTQVTRSSVFVLFRNILDLGRWKPQLGGLHGSILCRSLVQVNHDCNLPATDLTNDDHLSGINHTWLAWALASFSIAFEKPLASPSTRSPSPGSGWWLPSRAALLSTGLCLTRKIPLLSPRPRKELCKEVSIGWLGHLLWPGSFLPVLRLPVVLHYSNWFISCGFSLQGRGGPVNSILSWSAWVPLARMSYATYLVRFNHEFLSGSIDIPQVHMTIMQVVSSYDSYRVKVTHVS